MYRYRAFGLSIISDVAMSELSLEPDPALPVDLTIIRTELDFPLEPLGGPFHFDYEDPRGVLMAWSGVAAVLIVNPMEIWVQPHPDATPNLLPLVLLGPVMGWVLYQRHRLVLHASAVAWEGVSIGFLGDKLAGKSTTAAAFLRDGAQLLTDDLLAITTEPKGVCTIHPAFAQLKLSEEAAAAIALGNAEALPLVLPDAEKRQHRLSNMHARPTRCDFLFVLERGEGDAQIEWLSGPQALRSLIRYSYTVRFSRAPKAMLDPARLFSDSAKLANSARIGRLRVKADLQSLGQVIDRMREEASQHRAAAA